MLLLTKFFVPWDIQRGEKCIQLFCFICWDAKNAKITVKMSSFVIHLMLMHDSNHSMKMKRFVE